MHPRLITGPFTLPTYGVLLACAALLLRDGDEAKAARTVSAGPLLVVSISAEQVALTDEIEALGTARANTSAATTWLIGGGGAARSTRRTA